MGLLWTDVNINQKSPEKIINQEYRAPTDDSIRLYKEIEEKIHSEIAQKLLVKNNLIEYTLSFSKFDLISPKMYLKIQINGTEYSECFSLNKFEFINPEYLVKVVSEWLCGKILINPIKDIFYAYCSGKTSDYKSIGLENNS